MMEKICLSNPNADEKTRKVFSYICDCYGKSILTGQQESTWMSSPEYEMDYIREVTGKLPAIRGLDFMHDDYKGVVERAIAWDKKGGLVTICWHTGVVGTGYTESQSEVPDFDLLLTGGTEEYQKLMERWEDAAKALQELQEAGVPVLWRPFHEFDGKWFWWGKGGPENFVRLWRLMYDKFTKEYGLNNLIWVLGYADDVEDGWYPGDDYCDIIGSDTYRKEIPTHVQAWNKLRMISDKPRAFHECGNVPTVDEFEKDGALWAWFMVWHTEFITGNDKEKLSKVYNDEKTVTLEKVPKF